jgi:hypothetical protein
MLRKFIGLGLASVLLAAVSGLTSGLRAQPVPEPFPCACDLTAEQFVWGDVEVRTHACNAGDDETWQLRILERGRQVHEREGHRLQVSGEGLPPIGEDVTGDGRANVVAREWTGGAHGTYRLHVFELEPRVRLLQTLDAGHSPDAGFRDADGDGDLEVVLNDWTFACWRDYSFADSPAPEVVLSWRDHAFRLDAPAMTSPQPPAAALEHRASTWAGDPAWASPQALAASVRGRATSVGASAAVAAAGATARASASVAEAVDPPAGLVAEVLHLIYSGHAQAGWRLLSEAWPEGRDGHDAFALALLGQLSESPHWLDLDVSAR